MQLKWNIQFTYQKETEESHDENRAQNINHVSSLIMLVIKFDKPYACCQHTTWIDDILNESTKWVAVPYVYIIVVVCTQKVLDQGCQGRQGQD